jgi:putative nucleotidyltransferase with HDIG domain
MLLCLYGGGKDKAPSIIQKDEPLMRGISHQVSTALEETRLYVETLRMTLDLTRKVETIQTMHEIDRSILSTLEPEVVLDMAAMMVGKLIACDIATVCLVDTEREGLVYRAGFGAGDMEKGLFVPFADTVLGEVVISGRPRFVPDLKEAAATGSFDRGLIDRGVGSMLSVPLTVKSGVVGVLSLWSGRAAAYSPEDLSTLEKLSSQISIAFENSRLLTDFEELYVGVVRTLSEAIDAKSPWTRGHSERVTAIAVETGRAMELGENTMKSLEIAGLLHDIGKLGTYEAILDKPGKLTQEEIDMMKEHPGKGADILRPIGQMMDIVPVIRHHHEYYDGTGYPDGLMDVDIPPLARILAVADTVDAMSSDRPYRKGRSMEAIIEELKRCSGMQFDSKVVDAFTRTATAKGSSGGSAVG